MSPFDTKDVVRAGSYVLRDEVRAFDGIQLFRARDTRSDRSLFAKLVKDRNHLEVALWEYVTLGHVADPLVLRPLERSRDKRDRVLLLYEAEEFVTTELSQEAFLDAGHLAHDMLQLVGKLHRHGIVRLGLETSSFWLRPHQGYFTPVLVALRPQMQIPHRETYRPEAIAHERPRLKVSAATLAPEALLGEETDARADLYAVGAILYEILSGVPPLNADDVWTALANRTARPPAPLKEMRPDVPEGVSRVIARLLSFSPGERYSCAEAALADLDDRAESEGEGGSDSGVSRMSAAVTDAAFVRKPSALLIPDVVGRADALSRLETAVEAASAGSFQAVLLTGDDGMGKSRLVEELLARLKVRGMATYRGRYLPDERALYFRPFSDLYRAIYPPSRRVPESIERVATHLFPEHVSGSRQRGRSRRGPGGSPRREQIPEAISRLSHALAPESRCICLALEGFAGDDPDHQALLAALREQLSDRSLLLVVTLRAGTEPLKGEEGAEDTSWAERIDLAPLSNTELSGVIASALGLPEAPEAAASRIASQSQGSPLICQELIKRGEATGIAEDEPTDAGPATGPEDVIAARLESLSDEARLCLEAGAVLGPAFDRHGLLRLTEFSEDQLYAQLHELMAEDLIRIWMAGSRLEFSFPHPLYRRAILKVAPAPRRAMLHLRAAHLFEGKFKRGTSELLWDLAYHFGRGTDEAKKGRFCALAADRAADLFAVDAALRFYKAGVMTGVEDDRLAKVRPKLEGLLGLQGREDELRAIEEAAPEVTSAATREEPEALYDQGCRALQSTEWRKALKLLSTALERAQKDKQTEQFARTACSLGTLFRRLGSYDRAAEYLTRAIEQTGEEATSWKALAHADRGRVKLLGGSPEEALQDYETSIEIVGRVGDPNLEGYCRAGLGKVLLQQKRLEEAHSALLAAQQVVASGGDQGGVAWVALALALYFDTKRNDAEALAHYELAQRSGQDVRSRVRGIVGAARSLTRLDRLSEAEVRIQKAFEAAQSMGAFDLVWQAHAESGRALRLAGRLDESLLAYMRSASAIEVLMDQAPLARSERSAFLLHDGRLKAYRGLLAVRLLIEKNPSLIEFAADDYLLALIDRFSDDRYRQRKKLADRLERMVEWLLRNREQIRMRRAVPEASDRSQVKKVPPRMPKSERLEGKNLLRMAAILDSLGNTDAMEAHLVDMALDIVDVDRGVLALLSGSDMKAVVARDLKGRDLEQALVKLSSLRGHRDLEETGPIVSSPSRRDMGDPSLLLPLVKGDTLKGGIYVDGPNVEKLAEADKKYLKGFAALAVMALDDSRNQEKVLADISRLTKENRKLQQELARVQRERDSERVSESAAKAGEGERKRKGRRGRGKEEPQLSPEPVEQTEGEETPKLSRRARRAREKQEIVDALVAAGFDRKETAAQLGISRSTLNTRMRRYNVRIKRLRQQGEAPPAESAEAPTPTAQPLEGTPSVETGSEAPVEEGAAAGPEAEPAPEEADREASASLAEESREGEGDEE